MLSLQRWTTTSATTSFKSGIHAALGDGRRYVFHNTMLQAHPVGRGESARRGRRLVGRAAPAQPLTNTVSRNNIFHIWKGWWQLDRHRGRRHRQRPRLRPAQRQRSRPTPARSERHRRHAGLRAGPRLAERGGRQLPARRREPGLRHAACASPTSTTAQRPAPDVGAHQAGTPAMKFGVSGGDAAASRRAARPTRGHLGLQRQQQHGRLDEHRRRRRRVLDGWSAAVDDAMTQPDKGDAMTKLKSSASRCSSCWW